MTRSLRILLGCAVLATIGCADGEPTGPPPVQELAGFWTGTISFALQTAPTAGFGIGAGLGDTGRLEEVELMLAEPAAGQVTGAGALLPRQVGTAAQAGRTGTPVQARAFEVQGTVAFPHVSLTLRGGAGEVAPAELILLSGEFVALDRISGRLVGGGFNGERVELRRTQRTLP